MRLKASWTRFSTDPPGLSAAVGLSFSEAGMIDLNGVEKHYGRSRDGAALQGVDLTVEPGEAFGVIGRSGAGKSTLLRLLNGLVQPTAGRAFVDGVDIGQARGRQLRELRRRVAMVHQHFNLLSSRTAAGNVALPLEFLGVPPAEAKRRVQRLLDLVDLGAHADKYPAQLSGGQKQRVGIARALAVDPKLLLCDEITSALDPETTRQILRLIDRIRHELDITVVVITHEMSVVRQLCGRVAVLDAGRIVEIGPVGKVLSQPEHPVTQALLNSENDETDDPSFLLDTGKTAERAILALTGLDDVTVTLRRAGDRLQLTIGGDPAVVRTAVVKLKSYNLNLQEVGHGGSAAAAA
jgi:D-methionine transport system ATP-binding protein